MEKSWVDNALDEIKRQGMELGMERGKEQLIENALRGGSTPEEISRVTFVSVNDIQKIKDKMLTNA